MDESNQNMNNAQYNPQGSQPNMGQPQNNGAAYNPQWNGATYTPQGGRSNMNNAQYNPQGNAQYGQPNMGGGAQYAPNGVAYRAPRKPVDKDFVLMIISIVAAAVLIIVFFVVGNSSFGAENCAKKFYYSLNTNHPDDAFDMLDLKDDEFVNKKVFEENYGLSESDISAFNEKGLRETQADTSMSSDRKSATVYITSDSYTKYRSISINVKRDGNIFGIFPNWKVDASNIVAENVTFEVPTGATLTIDDKEVDKKYIDSSASDGGYENYVIPKMLIGYCQASASVEGLDAQPTVQDIYESGQSIYLNLGAPDEATLSAVSKQFYDAYTEAMNAAKDGKDFSEVESKINADGDTTEIKDAYDELVGEYAADVAQTGITSIEISNVKSKANYGIYDTLPTISVELNADYSIHHNTKGWFSDELSDTVTTDNGSLYAYYVLKDGNWVLDAGNSRLVPYIYVSEYN